VRHFHDAKQPLAGSIGVRLKQERRNNQSVPLIQHIIKHYRACGDDAGPIRVCKLERPSGKNTLRWSSGRRRINPARSLNFL
jgi:hypothetical protein